jgi:hypothetical protein
MKTYYTLFVNGELHTNIIDDMNTTEIWAKGGIIFLSKDKIEAYIENMKRYDDEGENPVYEIKEITI